MGNEKSSSKKSKNGEEKARFDLWDLSSCYGKINSCEKEMIKEISINLTTFVLENFRSLIFLFSFINDPKFLDQCYVKELRQSSKLAIWLSELNRKVYIARREILNYRKSFLNLVGKEGAKLLKDQETFLEDVKKLIKGNPVSISSFFSDVTFSNENWNLRKNLKEFSKILELKLYVN